VFHKSSNSGVALITVIFIVALVSSLATAMLTRLAKDIRRSEYNRHQGQLVHFMYGVESWAIGRLKKDKQNDARQGAIDHNKEVWKDKITLALVDNKANIEANLDDLQGKYNLNNLADKTASATNKKSLFNSHVKYFNRLLVTLEIDTRIADSIIDWLDQDNQVRFPHGAEDSEYLSKTPPYRAANRKLVSFSELNLIKGVTPKIIEQLREHVSILPKSTKINVNTASKEVLIALSPLLNSGSVENIIEQRKTTPFKTTKEFVDLVKKLTKKTKLEPANLQQLLSVNSEYFICESKIIMKKAKMSFKSLINRDKNSIIIIGRQRGIF